MSVPAKVAVNGYGTIGKRIADAVMKSSDFKLVGVTKYNFDYSVVLAQHRGIKVFVPREKITEFKERGVEPEGTVEELVNEAELVFDASPAKQGLKNKELYVKYNRPAIFQGGEPPEVAEVSYSTLCNYKSAIGRKYVRVVSCNTTGILRILCSLPGNVVSAFITIVRRSSDPREDLKGPVNSILVESPIPSHHAVDVRSVIDSIPITTVSLVVPTTLMHVQVVRLELRDRGTRDELIALLESSRRVLFVSTSLTGVNTSGKLVELARDAGRPRYDIYENVVFEDTFSIHGREVVFVQAIHQESIVIPENLDAAYALLGLEEDPLRVVEKTNKALGIGDLKDLITSSSKT